MRLRNFFNKKNSLPVLTFFLLLFLLSKPCEAQFKKFKSPTQLSAPQTATTPVAVQVTTTPSNTPTPQATPTLPSQTAQAPEIKNVEPAKAIPEPAKTNRRSFRRTKTEESTSPSAEITNPRPKAGPESIKDKVTQTPPNGDTDAQFADEEDIFGRGTGIKDVENSEKDKKYVNLNFETAFGPEVITSFDFPNVSLVELTKHMQKLTGINFILDKDIKGKISILAPSPITVGDAWKAYLTALNLNGYSMVKSGAFYKILNARDVGTTPTKIYTGTYTPDTENYVMRIIPLKNIDGAELERSFRPFMSRYGRILTIKQTNTIIVSDTGTNINRLVKLIRFLDVPGHSETLQIIPIKYSSAQEIAKVLDQILKGKSARFGASGGTEDVSKIIAEPRTNSIIAMANARGAKRLRELIGKLDVKGVASGSGLIHVYYLNYNTAENVSKTLSNLVSSSAASSGATRFTRTASGGGDASLFSGPVKITADEDNNALVISASPTDYLTLQKVIKKLDIPKDQVYVEGLIMETNVSRGSAFGISIVGAYGTGSTQKAGFVGGPSAGSDLMNVISNNITSLGGLFVGGGSGKKITKTIGGQSVEISSVSGLITAIATDDDTNILATPQILALDNTDAEFEVGETVPITATTTANNGQTTNSVSQQKVALTLKIKPQINKVTRFIKLKIDQKIDDFSDRAVNTTSGGVATTSRSAVTNVVVRDRDTIAMGGLMRDRVSQKTNKVPLLGDIPILGWLFKRKDTSTTKVNLLFFLTPKILTSYEKTAAKTMKDALNRRHAHLKRAVGGDDPFGSTVKGLYEKANKQDEGPLYDTEEAQRYLKENEKSTIEVSPDEEADTENVPNYRAILKTVEDVKGGKQALHPVSAPKELKAGSESVPNPFNETSSSDSSGETQGMNGGDGSDGSGSEGASDEGSI